MKPALNKTATGARNAAPKAPAQRRRTAAHAAERTASPVNGLAITRGSKRTEAFISALMGIRLK